jgi:site-specific DNA-cytosine methylase
MLNGLSLFSGIGGIDVALSKWVRTVCYCEIDPYCQAVLLSRMADESLSNSPIWFVLEHYYLEWSYYPLPLTLGCGWIYT